MCGSHMIMFKGKVPINEFYFSTSHFRETPYFNWNDSIISIEYICRYKNTILIMRSNQLGSDVAGHKKRKPDDVITPGTVFNYPGVTVNLATYYRVSARMDASILRVDASTRLKNQINLCPSYVLSTILKQIVYKYKFIY